MQPEATSDTIRNQSRDSNLLRAINIQLVDDGEDHNSFNDVTLKRPRKHEGPNLHTSWSPGKIAPGYETKKFPAYLL